MTIAEPLRRPTGDDPLLARAAGARVVLIGEASHGAHEFYRERAEITKRLIAEAGVTAVADWPDAYRVNRYGDARATQIGAAGELNIGQFCRERYDRECLLVGFTTYTGTVTAASDWGASAERKFVRPAGADLALLRGPARRPVRRGYPRSARHTGRSRSSTQASGNKASSRTPTPGRLAAASDLELEGRWQSD
jgi:erythromycin esterase-like protein